MTQRYRIIFQTYDDNSPDTILTEKAILEDNITPPTSCLDFSMGLEKQIFLIQTTQDCLIDKKINLLQEEKKECPKCKEKLQKFGNQKSTFSDVFTDHKLTIQRLRCGSCGYDMPATVRTLINTTQSGDLQRIQATLGATHTYREGEKIFELFSMKSRRINNHDRIKHVTESLGEVIEKIEETEKSVVIADPAKELVLAVDGGHIKTIEEDKRSMEAMASVIYRPEAICSNGKGTRHYLSDKSSAASVNEDNKQIISATIIAALKQGLTDKTHVTALCDGAINCWDIVEAVRPLCKSMTCILDWFHIGMKIENISLPSKLKKKFLRIKWHLWRGNVKNALTRLEQLIEISLDLKHCTRLKKFATYIKNNCDKIINYRERKKLGLVFTSQLAESTVESLINRRCKGRQHMRWSREGLNPVLKLRAAINSKDDWESKWKMAILNVK